MNEEINEDRVREIVKEELTNFTPPKKKRAPNKWQSFLKNCTREQDNSLSYPEKVQLCSVEYKEAKKNGKLPQSPKLSKQEDI